jgi:hypothetical protein
MWNLRIILTSDEVDSKALVKYERVFVEGPTPSQSETIEVIFADCPPGRGLGGGAHRVVCVPSLVVVVPYYVYMAFENILVWNMWGLNFRDRCGTLRDLVVDEMLSMICLLETKLASRM